MNIIVSSEVIFMTEYFVETKWALEHTTFG